MYLVKPIALSIILVGLTSAALVAQERGHFSSWKEVPEIVDSITENAYREQLERLHELTWIKLGNPQSSLCLSEDEHKSYMLQTKQRWQQWWNSTGQSVALQKEQDTKVDQQAFQVAWDFLGSKKAPPESILPVWIPAKWTLYVTFKNGDYQGREKEVWVIDRQTENVSFSKLRGDCKKGSWIWQVVLAQHNGLTPAQADQILKSLCYVHCYAPVDAADVKDDQPRRFYYPHSTLRLRDGNNQVLWNTQGFEFCKSVPEHGDGMSGRSFLFLQSMFSDAKEWKEVLEPTSEQLAPYRKLLSSGKPYLDAYADDIVRLFGNRGGNLERQALLDWADKQQLATAPEMDWKVCCGDFNTGAKVNVTNFTSLQIQRTLKEIKKINERLEKSSDGGHSGIDIKAREIKLERYVANLLAAKRKEKEDTILGYPQPLQSLISTDEHPDDPNLKHLSVAVQAIRDNPNPDLFKQLVHEMNDDGTLKMRSLLRNILLNEHEVLKVRPWENQQEAIAINACIDQLPAAVEARRRPC